MALDITYGVSTWLWTSPFTTASIHEIFPKISKMGFDVVEIAVEDPSLIDIKEVKKALKIYGLKANICGAFGPARDFTNEDESYHKSSFSYIEACLDFCVEVETKFFGGPMYSAVGKARMLSPELRKVEWDRAVKNLRMKQNCQRWYQCSATIQPWPRLSVYLHPEIQKTARGQDDVGQQPLLLVGHRDSYFIEIYPIGVKLVI